MGFEKAFWGTEAGTAVSMNDSCDFCADVGGLERVVNNMLEVDVKLLFVAGDWNKDEMGIEVPGKRCGEVVVVDSTSLVIWGKLVANWSFVDTGK